MRIVAIVLIAALSVVLMVGCSSQASKTSDITIVIRNYDFEPGVLNIKAGQHVTWINLDPAKHKIVGTNFKMSSDELSKEDTYTQKFEKAGTFTYQCRLHPRMKGTIVVK